jgi:4-diphosphocytidyl-2-C-methyl-D-erythritol kinase
MSNEARLSARAKINLRLVVLARQTDGYHAIETLFHRIELADDVMVRVGGKARSIDCRGMDVGPPAKNLAFRAAVAYAAAAGWPDGFEIEIEKRIPAGGGLGGGSADAGAVLRALDSLCPAPLGRRLAEIAISLGSDIPFLTLDAAYALAWGRGERLLTLNAPPARSVALVFPNFSVATADAYGWLASDRGSGHPTSVVLDPGSLAEWDRIAEVATNDFDAVVGRRHPEIGRYLEVLRAHGASIAMLSGSGSSVFGIFETQSAAAAALAATGARGALTRTADRG